MSSRTRLPNRRPSQPVTQPTEYRCVVSWAGADEPIKLVIYDARGEVVAVVLTPTRALELAKQLMEPAVSSIKTGQWGKPWPG